MPSLIDMTGQIICGWKILKKIEREKGDRKSPTKYSCICLSCGNTYIRNAHSIRRNTSKGCITCSNKKFGIENKKYKGLLNVSWRYFRRLRRGAKVRGIFFNISVEYLQKLLEDQNFICSISGIKLIMTPRRAEDDKLNTASLDRIDSSKGYEEGNVQWVHKDINLMKMNIDQEKFINYCRLITESQKNK